MLLTEEQIKEAVDTAMPAALASLKSRVSEIIADEMRAAIGDAMRAKVTALIVEQYAPQVAKALGEAMVTDMNRRLERDSDRRALLTAVFNPRGY